MAGTKGERDSRYSDRRTGREDQLALEDDRHLPWLDADEEDEPALDTARIVAFAMIALVALSLLAGAAWWLLQDGSRFVVADGSTIEAPEGPYKTRPEDPGGKIHMGTGNLSFAVGEGQTRKIRVAQAGAAPPVRSASGEEGKEEGNSGIEPGVGVQVGAFSSHEEAQRGWSDLLRRIPVLDGVGHRIVEGQADIGTVFRLQAVAPDSTAADELCQQVRAQGGACEVRQ